jgi:hypothetical protein
MFIFLTFYVLYISITWVYLMETYIKLLHILSLIVDILINLRIGVSKIYASKTFNHTQNLTTNYYWFQNNYHGIQI